MERCRYSVIDQRGQLNCLFNENAVGCCEVSICPLRLREKRARASVD